MSCDKPAVSVAPLSLRDLPAALKIQSDAHPAALIENESAFLSRMERATSYCLAAKQGEELLGYLLAHGWKRQSPPSIGATLDDEVPSEILFIHDLAVASSGRGLGIGRKLITRAFELSAQDGLRTAELIAVEGAADYWRQLGFVTETISDELQATLATYGNFSCWMTRAIGQGDLVTAVIHQERT
jgi:ribosomal protein S18 acetylase RimI-like enzyme